MSFEFLKQLIIDFNNLIIKILNLNILKIQLTNKLFFNS